MRHLLAFPRLFPAAVFLMSLTVTIPIRERSGLRTCAVGQFTGLAIVVLLLPHLLAITHGLLLFFFPVLMFVGLPDFDIHVSPFFTLYLLALPVIAFWQRSRERARLCRGEALHSYCRGISRLEFLARRFPSRITLNHVYCYLEPAAVFVAGVLAYFLISAALGGWWMVAALALFVREQTNAMAELNTVLDKIDQLLEARQRAHIDALIRGDTGLALGMISLAQSGGITTGIATEIVPSMQALRLETPAPLAEVTPHAGAGPVALRRIIDAA